MDDKVEKIDLFNSLIVKMQQLNITQQNEIVNKILQERPQSCAIVSLIGSGSNVREINGKNSVVEGFVLEVLENITQGDLIAIHSLLDKISGYHVEASFIMNSKNTEKLNVEGAQLRGLVVNQKEVL